MSASRATSYRIDPSIKARLEAQAAAEHTTERALLERLVAEGLDTLHHPGIVFRDGPTGRRAALAVGPDVWEVISALRSTTGAPEQRVRMLASSSICTRGTSAPRSTTPPSTATTSTPRSPRTTRRPSARRGSRRRAMT